MKQEYSHRDFMEARTLEVAEYIIDNRATVRDAAKEFGVSKDTVYLDVTKRLPDLDLRLHGEVSEILNHNLETRHIRGGAATKAKSMNKKMN